MSISSTIVEVGEYYAAAGNSGQLRKVMGMPKEDQQRTQSRKHPDALPSNAGTFTLARWISMAGFRNIETMQLQGWMTPRRTRREVPV